MRDELIRGNAELLRQGAELVRGLPRQLYAVPDGGEPGDAIGPHVRHCLEFYECFLDGAAVGRVDYDARRRDARVETDPREAARRMDAAADRLESGAALPDAVRVRMDATPAMGDDAFAPSGTDRELQFLASHTVHHFALIALLLRQAGRSVPAGFGVATATARHREAALTRDR